MMHWLLHNVIFPVIFGACGGVCSALLINRLWRRRRELDRS